MGAGILTPGVKEGLEQPISQIIVMRDIATGPRRRVKMTQPGRGVAKAKSQSVWLVAAPMFGIAHQEFHERLESAVADGQPAVHVGLAKG